MLNNITITNFRGIEQLTIEKFSQINLFFGKNNCGKSTILEAIFLLSGLSNPLLPININKFRDFSNISEESLWINFHNYQKDKPINIKGSFENNIERNLKISTFRSYHKIIDINKTSEQSSNNNLGDFYGLKLNFNVGKNTVVHHSELIIDEKQDANKNVEIKVDEKYKENIIAKYLPPKQIKDTAIGIKEIINNKQKENLIIALQKIDKKIIDINIVGDDIMVDIGINKLIPINVMGDGIRRLLSIIISIYDCRNGILLIDEIDNGFHFSVMKILWETIIEYSRLNNTQLFITTHNIDSIIGLRDVLLTDDFNNFQDKTYLYKLLCLPNDKIESLCYDFDKFDYSINQELEMR